jgi:hypothetical protein
VKTEVLAVDWAIVVRAVWFTLRLECTFAGAALGTCTRRAVLGRNRVVAAADCENSSPVLF